MADHPDKSTKNPAPTAGTPAGTATLQEARRNKLHKIEDLGFDPWGGRFDGNQPIGEILGRLGEIVVTPSTEEGKHSRRAWAEGSRRGTNRSAAALGQVDIGCKFATGPARSR